MIIFGGLDNANDLSPPGESLYVLHVGGILYDYAWHIPTVTGKIPSSRAFHEAVLIGKYMVVTFGKYKLIEILYI